MFFFPYGSRQPRVKIAVTCLLLSPQVRGIKRVSSLKKKREASTVLARPTIVGPFLFCFFRFSRDFPTLNLPLVFLRHRLPIPITLLYLPKLLLKPREKEKLPTLWDEFEIYIFLFYFILPQTVFPRRA